MSDPASTSHIPSGVINVDKQGGLSSARVVDRVKPLLPPHTKIGHAGTLDPFATGVLLLLVGRATKSCEAMMDARKGYDATIKFGATTATEDPTSPEEMRAVDAIPSREAVDAAIGQFVGEIEQRPSSFSAIKIGGKRAYKLARRGEAVSLEPRRIRIYSIEVRHYEWPFLKVSIECGRGTYVRAIARDLGEALQVGGYLTELRRTFVGPFRVEDAKSLEELDREGIVLSDLTGARVDTISPGKAALKPVISTAALR